MAERINNLHVVSGEINDRLQPPPGWFIPGDAEAKQSRLRNENEQKSEKAVFEHLPAAAKWAEQLVAAIENKTNIEIPETYMRVEADTKFHVLLLVNPDDFHAPQMAVARILAEEFTKMEDRFDIHYSFSTWTGFENYRAIFTNDYKLKHLNHEPGIYTPDALAGE